MPRPGSTIPPRASPVSSAADSRMPTCPVWSSFLLGYGGGFVDANGKLMTETTEAIEAAKMYQTLLAKYGPQGVAGYNWNESQSLFAQGKAAMWLDGIGFAAPLEDPTKSRIVGKVGYGVMPAGPKQQASALFGDGQGVSAFSKKKGPAWFYLQWASNKANQTRILQNAAGAPVRNSAYQLAQSSGELKSPEAVGRVHGDVGADRAARPAGDRAGDGVPRHVRHRADQHDQRRRSRDGTEEGHGGLPAGIGQEREGLKVPTPPPGAT